MQYLYKIFVSYGAIIPICLCFSSFIIKHYIVQISNKLIPLINLVMAILFTLFWYPLYIRDYPVVMRIFNGFLYGLVCTGLHQLFKQTSEYIRIHRYLRRLKKVKTEVKRDVKEVK